MLREPTRSSFGVWKQGSAQSPSISVSGASPEGGGIVGMPPDPPPDPPAGSPPESLSLEHAVSASTPSAIGITVRIM